MSSRFGRTGWVLLWAVVLGAGCAKGSTAASAICGNGLVEGNEACDDGNVAAGDGCSKDCAVEVGFDCASGDPSLCTAICGDGLITGAETCDGSNVNEKTCESLSLGSGTLTCDSDCQLNADLCSAYSCGNGLLDVGEQCDGANVGTATCQDQGYDGGTLACRLDCTLDISGCTLASCGNGIIEGIEACDDGNTTSLDGCSSNCTVEEGWGCDGEPSSCELLCGNGVLDTGEQCDGAKLGGQDCTTLGMSFEGGTLACGTNCHFDTSDCELPTCGNGTLDAAEQCDGVLLNDETCETLGFIGGTLLCSASCGFDVSGCVPIVCGDGIISSGEVCDDGNQTPGDGCNILCNVEQGWECTGEPSSCSRLCGNGTVDSGEECDGATIPSDCQTEGFDSGTLGCDSSACQFDTSGCRMATCGDGHKDSGEDCDGADLGTADCVSLGFVSGMLHCTTNCGYDTSSCVAPACGDGIITASAGEQCDDNNTGSGDGCNAACQVENGWTCESEPSVCELSCGNGTWDPGEECDTNDLHGGTCQGEGFAGGTLGCDSTCHYDTSQCLASVCPNGVREGSEQCDTNDLNSQDCTDFGFSAGTLACDGTCSFDTSGCVNAVCGNGAVESGEECDDSNTSPGDGCDETCQWEQACTADDSLACGGSDYQFSWPSGNDVDDYSCTSSFGGGGDRVYSFTPSSSGSATVDIDCDDSSSDADLYILEGACNPELCLDYSVNIGCDNMTFPVTAGTTYYIVVEDYNIYSGYTVYLTCP